jgi:hypothetical protein
MSGSTPAASPTRSAPRRRDDRAGVSARIGNAFHVLERALDRREDLGQLALHPGAVRRRQRVHADVRVRHAVDHARERPTDSRGARLGHVRKSKS